VPNENLRFHPGASLADKAALHEDQVSRRPVLTTDDTSI
jgi:hypothetical protein